MADYHPLISRLVAGLDDSTADARRSFYQRARAALAVQLQINEPCLSELQKFRERMALETAIRRVEAEWAHRSCSDPEIAKHPIQQVPDKSSVPRHEISEVTTTPIINKDETCHVRSNEASILVNEGWKDRSKEKPLEDDAKPNSAADLNGIRTDLTEIKKYNERTATEITNLIEEENLKIIFLETDFPNKFELFNVERKGNTTELTFNRKHPAFSRIFATLNMDHEHLRRLTIADWLSVHTETVNAVKIIFGAWARYEREAGIARLSGLQRVRYEWGQIAAQFLEPDEKSPV